MSEYYRLVSNLNVMRPVSIFERTARVPFPLGGTSCREVA